MNSGAIVSAPKLLGQAVRRALGAPLAPVLVVKWERGTDLRRQPHSFTRIRDMRLGQP